MEKLLPYLLKASLILIVLFGYYHFTLANSKKFTWNRWLLLSIIVCTLAIPLLSFNVFAIPEPIAVDCLNCPPGPKATPTALFQNQWATMLILGLYFVGMAYFLLRFVIQLSKILNLINSGNRVIYNNHTLIVNADFPVSSSFFNYIFTRNANENNIIIEHESIHVRNYHSFDVLLSEIFKIVFWFHPLAHLLQRSIKLNHEFLCDEAILSSTDKGEYFNLLINLAESQQRDTLINHFSSFIKKRIIMITNNNVTKLPVLKYFLILPIIFGFLTLYSFKTYIIKSTESQIGFQNDTIPKNFVDFDRRLYIIDTIAMYNPETKVEEIKVIKSRVPESDLVKWYPKHIELIDTIATFDDQTNKENVIIVKSKIKEAYYLLIQEAYRLGDPDPKLIDQWRKKGKVE